MWSLSFHISQENFVQEFVIAGYHIKFNKAALERDSERLQPVILLQFDDSLNLKHFAEAFPRSNYYFFLIMSAGLPMETSFLDWGPLHPAPRKPQRSSVFQKVSKGFEGS